MGSVRKEIWNKGKQHINIAKDAFDFYFPNNGRKGWSDDRDLKRPRTCISGSV